MIHRRELFRIHHIAGTPSKKITPLEVLQNTLFAPKAALVSHNKIGAVCFCCLIRIEGVHMIRRELLEYSDDAPDIRLFKLADRSDMNYANFSPVSVRRYFLENTFHFRFIYGIEKAKNFLFLFFFEFQRAPKEYR